MAVDDTLPDELRCNRTDGRDWRCKRPVMEGKKLCEIHFVQGRLRQYKEKVPDALKFKHGENRKPSEHAAETAAVPSRGGTPVAPGCVGVRVSERMSAAKRKRGTVTETIPEVETLDSDDKLLLTCSSSAPESGKRMKTELIRMFVKREMDRSSQPREKKKQKKMLKLKVKKKTVEVVRAVSKELTRDLPYGVMEIAPEEPAMKAETLRSGESAGHAGIKLGVPSSTFSGNRKFRSKNANPPPICTVKASPFGKNVGKLKTSSRRKCHWCRMTHNRCLVKCASCRKVFFCEDCIKDRYKDVEEVKFACPVCHGMCNCKNCWTSSSKDVGTKEILKSQCCKITKNTCLRYLIQLLLPVIEKINQKHDVELQMVAKIEGKELSEVAIRQEDSGCLMQLCCNNCNSAIMNLHKSCLRCSYALCLDCCGYFDQGGWLACSEPHVVKEQFRVKPCSSKKSLGEKEISRYMESVGSTDSASDISLPDSTDCCGIMTCPSRESGGCHGSLLDLRCLFPYNWMKELEKSAEFLLSSHDDANVFGDSLICSSCAKVADAAAKDEELIEAARRKSSSDNFLYRPHARGDHDILLIHFQKHWRKGHPVIVRNIMLDGEADVTCDPAAMFCSYLERKYVESATQPEPGRSQCSLDWYEVEFGVNESFTWSLEDSHLHLQRETMKMKAVLSSAMSHRLFMDRFAEILNLLPLQEYTNPTLGLLNLAANPTDYEGPELGMRINILYGSREEVARGSLVTCLQYHSHDLINVLVHASEATCTIDLRNKLRRLLEENSRNKKEQLGQNMQNGAKLEHSEITDEAGKARIGDETHLGSTTNLETSNTSTVKFHGSDTDSDASMILSGTNDSPEKHTNEFMNADKSCKRSEKKSGVEPCNGALWDIFRREDVSLLFEYIRGHSDEFSGENVLHHEAAHPVLDGRIFLDIDHKMRLKEEFGIEPWTFCQRVGEAVMIPAGCVYQTRSLKSCIHVTTGFISPESALESIKMMEQLRVLPKDHRAKKGILEVQKMALYRLGKAIEEVSKSSPVC